MTNAISWTLDVDIHPGRQEDFQALMTEMVAATKADEPDALFYEWNTTNGGAQCQIYERYRDSAAVMTHLGNFGAHFAERFMDIMTPTRFVIYGKPSDEVRAALADLNPTYMEFAAGFSR